MKRLLFFLGIIIPAFLVGQITAIPIKVSVFNESTALPYTRFFTTPVHPGIQVGTEYDYRATVATRLFQTANLSYFYHNYLAQGIGINSELGYEYRLKSGIAFAGLLGVGYMHTFNTDEEFTFANGQYVTKTDKGNARLFPSLSVELGYYLKTDAPNSTKLFINYQSWAEYPYSPDFIPVMTHINLHLGVKIVLNKKTSTHE